MAQSNTRITLPGFGLPVDTLLDWSRENNSERFPHAIADFFASDGVTVRERRMLDFITLITDKPEWHRKVFDDQIVSKWKSEACRYDQTSQDDFLSNPMFDYCMSELREKAATYEEKGLVAVMDAEATVVKSDSAVPESLRQSLLKGVRPLEDVPDRYKDWHPGSDEEMDDREWAEEHGFGDDYRDWWEGNRVLEQPEPGSFKPLSETLQAPGARAIDLKSDFKASGLQVIFKLANIHLTPEKPEYSASNWHVEGALNEHICATAIYYYDSENVTDSFLGFRQSVDAEAMVMRPQQNEWSSALEFYGIENEAATIQDLGRVLTRQGRLLAFPNVMQHQVQPFRLADPTKPGHRKILAMFLVDPHVPILSTANVPPQRKDWWAEEVRKVDRFAALPEELFQNIIDSVEDFPFSWGEALEMRERLMEERGRVTDDVNQAMEEDTFFFCEH
ncbi:putative duf1665 domain containing protein [Neofusicoccum parvum UCRNP2]|uniref:Putative duf1665 domain containing protein n=1 Tax=Botryosphaeria parva (strain UCR-NP2) TaxID=1287680 RepID=R1EG48_BOTPV|nr:putative duf1665 domain containing protein [Neofusicoccum parvum UCRNP2]